MAATWCSVLDASALLDLPIKTGAATMLTPHGAAQIVRALAHATVADNPRFPKAHPDRTLIPNLPPCDFVYISTDVDGALMECVGQSTDIGPVDGVRITRGICVMNLKEMEFEIMTTPASRVALMHLTPGGKHGKFSACPLATAIGSTQLALDQLMIAQRQLALSKREREEYEALKLEVAHLRELRNVSSSALPVPSLAPVPIIPAVAPITHTSSAPSVLGTQRRTPPRMRQKVGSPRNSSPVRNSPRPTRRSLSPTQLTAQQKMLLSPVPRDMLSQQVSPQRSHSRSPPMQVFNNPVAAVPVIPVATSPVPLSPTKATRFSPVPLAGSPALVEMVAPTAIPLTSPVYDSFVPLPDSDEEGSNRSLSPVRQY
eukprot:TRINITY_DN2868_c0_g1_i1.p1 TRINITY_DN2868_c0_g1~~TRINITY_DN2868_c0_g1_i1.p1  ORF type:complete len:372 (+),score=58.22 TRINITY_DN2868_c0_g1_i1:830-1945(+)